jgi:tetratricopeptide (TPR) repeat protein
MATSGAPSGALAAGAPRPMAITDHPPPNSTSPDALAAYAAALQAFRDSSWAQAAASLTQAVNLDPSFPAARLRLALVLGNAREFAEMRAHYTKALQGRALLSPRDQDFLHALEPALGRDPIDHALTAERLRAMTKKYPADAEVFYLLANHIPDASDEMVEAARRATTLDPKYADAWQAIAHYHRAHGDTDQELEALDHCIDVSSNAADCRVDRAHILGAAGRCAEMAEGLRQALVNDPSVTYHSHDKYAMGLHAAGRPLEMVREAFRQKWAKLSEAKRRPAELYDEALLDIATGQFARAEERALEGSRLVALDQNAATHRKYVDQLVAIYVETGRGKDAARVADGYLKRKDVWLGSERSVDLLRVMRQTGALSGAEFEARRASEPEPSARSSDETPFARWWDDYVKGIALPEEATAALDALAKDGSVKLPRVVLPSSWLGVMYLLAGRPEEAIAPLRGAVGSCTALSHPAENIRAGYHLGQALEKTGAKAGACDAYMTVLERWGTTTPKSITAEKARARVKAMGCPARPTGAASK